MPTIVETRDWRRLVSEAGDDLASWYDSENAIDWPRTLAQPNWHLITDGQGSWCLLEPVSPVYAADQHHQGEAHLIIAPTSRGRHGLTIARDMLAWIDALGVQSLMAKVTERKTMLFLRWLGFKQSERLGTMTRAVPLDNRNQCAAYQPRREPGLPILSGERNI